MPYVTSSHNHFQPELYKVRIKFSSLRWSGRKAQAQVHADIWAWALMLSSCQVTVNFKIDSSSDIPMSLWFFSISSEKICKIQLSYELLYNFSGLKWIVIELKLCNDDNIWIGMLQAEERPKCRWRLRVCWSQRQWRRGFRRHPPCQEGFQTRLGPRQVGQDWPQSRPEESHGRAYRILLARRPDQPHRSAGQL